MTELVILGRDGVINQDSDKFIKNPTEWTPIPGSLEAIARLNHAGYKIAVATNQPGVALDLFDINTLNAIHGKFQHLLARVGGHIDGIFYCPHSVEKNCNCHKPKPGLYQTISNRFSVPLKGIPIIDGSLKDLDAAIAVDASPILVKTGNSQSTLINRDDLRDIPSFNDLAHAVDALLEAP